MDYYVKLFPEAFPGAIHKEVMIDGIPTMCVVIPLSSPCYRIHKTGNLALNAKAKENRYRYGDMTHTIKPAFPNDEERAKYYSVSGPKDIGQIYLNRPMSMNKPHTNDGTPIMCVGAICLDQIPQEAIFLNPRNNKRYVRLVFRLSAQKNDCDDTHELYVNPKYGAEGGRAESPADGVNAPLRYIGYFKELRNSTEQQRRISETINGSTAKTEETNKKIDGYEY